jgi:hypothetical protein
MSGAAVSKPKIFLLRDDERWPLEVAFREADHATCPGHACPRCGSEAFGVNGSNKRPSEDDRAWEADGYSTCCNAFVGTIRLEVSTLFGVREDRAVLGGRCCVY